ncbi:MAG: zinc-binding dehydrogenase [Treponema sp.]|nr:zinc-binding dehydrogenase [Treponema sp.]
MNKPFDYGLADLRMPECAHDGVIVKVLAAALCHSDLDIIEGRRRHQVKFPNTVGHEFTGIIAEKGKGVTHVNIGDHVVCECIIWCGTCKQCRMGFTSLCDNFSELGTMEPGAFAQYTALPGRLVHPAEGLTIEEAALMEPAGNGLHAAETAGILPGDNVVIIGPGPIGILAMQFAASFSPAKLIMIGTRDSRLAFAKQLGATHIININKTNAAEAVMEITGGRGAERIINCATTDVSLETALRITGKNAVIVMEGLSGSGKPVPIMMDDFIVKNFSIVPASGVSTRQYMTAMEMVKNKKVNLTSLVSHKFPLEQMDEVLRTIREDRDKAMKILILPNGSV